MSNREIVILAILDTLKWVGLISAVGLIQALIHILVASFVTKVTFTVSGLVASGSLVSFCLAIVSSIYFDAHFQKKHDKKISSEEFNDLFFKLFPWIIVVMVTVSTVLNLVLDSAEVDKEAIVNMQLAAVVMSYVYTLFYKYNSYVVGLKNAF